MIANIFVHPSSVIDEPCNIGAGTQIWHFSHIMSGATIGRGCTIGQGCFVAANVRIGNNVKLQNNVSIYTGVDLEDDVFCGPAMVFTNVTNPRSAIARKDEYQPTRVGRGATIGANATIVCGNNIGRYAFIAAGSVVTREVMPYAMIVGVPGRQVGWMTAGGHRIPLDLPGYARCPTTKEEYALIDGQLTVVS